LVAPSIGQMTDGVALGVVREFKDLGTMLVRDIQAISA
jgi:hypothetical protein